MSDTGAAFENLAEHAHATHVVVIGGGIAGLVAALECAEVGLRVTLLEERETVGGTIRAEEVGGARIDVGADGYATAGGHVRALIERLGLESEIAQEAPVRSWVSGIPAGAAPYPSESVLGIPANPWDPASRLIIGWRGAWRAYLDRLRPPLTIGQEHNLDTLVRRRMGDRVVDRLVAPLSMGRHGLLPSQVDVEVAAPGLNAALTRTGSLGGAVSQVRGARSGGAPYETLAGGMTVLVAALEERLHDLGAVVRTGSRAVEVVAEGTSGWKVLHDDGDLSADAVVVALPEAPARALLSPLVPGLDAEATGERILDVATLVVTGSALASPPRGAAVYGVPGSGPGAAAVVTTARWPWLAARLGSETRVVRVQFPGGAPEGDPALVAREAASALLGVSLDEGSVLGARMDRYSAALPQSAVGQIAEAARVRAAVRPVPGLVVIGAWIAGSGLAQVIPDAVAEAERVRRHALFGESSAD